MAWWRRTKAPEAPAVIQPVIQTLTPPPLAISHLALDELRRTTGGPTRHPFGGVPKPPPGVIPEGKMAMDDAGFANGTSWSTWATGGLWGEGLFFPGYPYLAELQQRPEYRNIVGTIAEEMTRKWIKLVSIGDDPDAKAEKIADLDDMMKDMDLRGAFRRAIELDGAMGMGMIYVDTGATDDPDELRMPLLPTKEKVARNALKGFVVIDPTWCSPLQYNSTDPLKPDFFKPAVWYVMGKQVHASRLIIVRSREVPDILKASYNFGGLSLAQMAKPYVDNWLRTRQSVSDLLHSFTTWVLKTDMVSYLQNAGQLAARLAAFVLGRDNRGLMMVDKETEELDNISAPLGTLDHLQAQAQEQMASVSKEPLIKMLGITPTGLNASGEAEIRNWYDHVHAQQEAVLQDALTYALKIMQLSAFGTIDDEIMFEFVPLWELDAAGRAAVEKIKADTDAVYMADSVITNDEVRARLKNDPDSPYHGLEGDAPEVPEPMDQFDADNKDDADKIGKEGAESKDGGANSGV